MYDETDNQNQDNQPDPYADKRNAVGQWYKTYLGREGSADEINGWAQNNNFGGVENSIKNSAEGQAYANKSQQQQAPLDQWHVPNTGTAGNPYRGTEDSWIGWLRGGGGGASEGRNGFFNTNASVPDLVNQFNASGGGHAKYIGGPSGDMVDFGDGRGPVDVHTAGGQIWYNEGQYGGGGAGGGGFGGPGGGGPGGGGPGSGGPQWDALYEQLLNRSKQSLNLDPNDPIIKAQTDAYNATGERARRQFLSSQAESNSPYSTGNQLGQERMSAERLGSQNSGFQAQLMGRELSSRRDEIQNALSQMGGMLSEQQRNALQRELGYLNDATERYGIGTQAQTARDRLGYDIGNSDMNYYLRSQGL